MRTEKNFCTGSNHILSLRRLRVRSRTCNANAHTFGTRNQLPTKRPRCVRQVRVGRSRTGFGLFATEPFKKGAYIAEYWGRKLTDAQADASYSKYLFELNSRWTIDGSTRKNTARYINHSCRPNAEADVVRGKIVIRAIKTIREGDEITYDYGKNYFKAFIGDGCRCDKCRERRSAGRKKSAAKRPSAK